MIARSAMALHSLANDHAEFDELSDDLTVAHREHADALRVQRDHYRSMYRACFMAACDQQVEIERQRRQLAELHEERARYARSMFSE